LGTLDELSEALTLIQTGKIESFPVVLIGCRYWQPFADLLQHMASEGTISPADLDLLLITDSVTEAQAHIHRYAAHVLGMTRPPVHPRGLLGEKQPEAAGGR
jgi:predicted Rossmann-fold nucleotide-binding protein